MVNAWSRSLKSVEQRMATLLLQVVARRANGTSSSFSSNISGGNSSPQSKDHLRGIFPALSTPFKRMKSEAVSWKNLEKNLIQWSAIPYSGYTLHSFFGEYPYLTNEERMNTIQMVRNIAGPKKTIIAGSSSESLKKTIDICELMKKCGADYSLIFTPHYYKKQMSYSALLEYFTKVADKSPLPVILHNMPSITFIDLPAELCTDLADHPNIVGLKECSHNIAKIAFICEQLKLKSHDCDFSVLAGSASFVLDALRVGAVGSISALASVIGSVFVELYDLHRAEKEMLLGHDHDNSTNELRQQKLNQIKNRAQCIQNQLIQPDLTISESYGVAGIKAALDLFGFYGGPCRLPLSDLSEEEIGILRSTFESNGFDLPNKENAENAVHAFPSSNRVFKQPLNQ